MLGSLTTLCEDAPLRIVLAHYRSARDRTAKEQWCDRLVIKEPTSKPWNLSDLHGTLLAWGWLETQVGRDSLSPDGSVKSAYRITADGLRALRATEDRLGNVLFVPPGDNDFQESGDEEAPGSLNTR